MKKILFPLFFFLALVVMHLALEKTVAFELL